MKKKMLFVIPICTAALIGIFAVSIYAAAVNNKLDLDLTANSGSQVTNISDQAAAVTNISVPTIAEGKNDKVIQEIVNSYKNAGKIISDEQVRKLNELYNSQEADPVHVRLWYKEGVIIGDIDPNAPKLDLAVVKDIIARTDSFEEIMSEIDKIQEYPDSVFSGSGLSFYSYHISTYEVIFIIYEQCEINYQTYNSDGTLKSSERLYGIYG